MLNQEEFINRLHKIFNHYGLSASVFADEIKVQRSSVSHLLSGRNKPSLEFVLKIIDTYKEVDIDWLLHGKNQFPKKAIVDDVFKKENPKIDTYDKKKKGLETRPVSLLEQKKTTSSEVEKIVVFYKDGTFKEYSEK